MPDLDVEALARELRRDEAVKLRPYRDSVGKLTIGVGHNLDDKGISRAVADLMLSEDIAEVLDGLDRELPWWRRLDPVRQRVLANMAFNLGVDGLLPGGRKPGFPRTIALIKKGQYLDAAQQMLQSKWARQVGKRAVRLATMMRDGG